jgi:ubiquinone/menaquinone biosynthesis C-methylase UbiE
VGEWWQEFFSGLWQQAQLGWWSEDETRAAADKVERALGLSSPAKVLDVPCGDGRISIELAARGHDVTGVDLNETFLAEAARKAGDRGLSARWEQGDMRDLSFESEYEAALNFWGSFGYFDEGGNERTAASAWRALTPGGRFLIEVLTAETCRAPKPRIRPGDKVFPRVRSASAATIGDPDRSPAETPVS